MTTVSLDFPYACDSPCARAMFKAKPEDFIVEEVLPFEPSGNGEHLLLFTEKQNQNTYWIAKKIAAICQLHKSKVSFAGLKDRYGITKQWFSIHLPGKPDDDKIISSCNKIEGARIIKAVRHQKKLQTGTLLGNRFTIILKNYSGDKKETEQRLNTIKSVGVPNYFGYQRFGISGNNIAQALKMFDGQLSPGRETRSILLSAARSFIFNAVVGERIKLNTWNHWQPGDIVTFPDNQSVIFPENQDNNVVSRCNKSELLLTAPMWGKGQLRSDNSIKELEYAVANQYPELTKGLEDYQLKQQRRAMQLLVKELSWNWGDNSLSLTFFLTRGAYATSVLKEIIDYQDMSLINT